MIPGGFVLLVSIMLAVSVIRLSFHNTLAQDLTVWKIWHAWTPLSDKPNDNGRYLDCGNTYPLDIKSDVKDSEKT